MTQIGRRANLDPVDQLTQSNYSVLNNSPITFKDPLGLYCTKAEAEQMRTEAKRAGKDPGEVYQSGDDWGFNYLGNNNAIVGTFKRNYFEGGTEVKDGSDLGFDPVFENPIMRLYGTIQAYNAVHSWVIGSAPGKDYNGPGSGYSYMMKNSPGVRIAVDHYIKNNGHDKQPDFAFSPSMVGWDNFKETFAQSLMAHWDALVDNTNFARFSIGGYSPEVITIPGHKYLVRIRIKNDMSLGSFTFHSEWGL